MDITSASRSLLDIIYHPLNRHSKVKTLTRIIWWKINQIYFKFPAIVQLTSNRKCICYPDSSSGGLIIYKLLFDYKEMTYLLRNLRENDVFFDIGANIGDYSLIASSIITRGKIFSFEPDKVAIQRFKENIILNNLRNVTLIDKVVSDKNSFEYYDYEKESEVNHISYKGKNSNLSKKIPCIKLDSFLRENNVNVINFLKIDVEGAEMKVLKGASESLKKHKIKKILLELNGNNVKFGTNNREIVKYLAQKGYGTFIFKKGKLVTLKNVQKEGIINVICK